VALGCRSLNSRGIKTAASSRTLFQEFKSIRELILGFWYLSWFFAAAAVLCPALPLGRDVPGGLLCVFRRLCCGRIGRCRDGGAGQDLPERRRAGDTVGGVGGCGGGCHRRRLAYGRAVRALGSSAAGAGAGVAGRSEGGGG